MGVEFESVFGAAWRRWGVVHYVAYLVWRGGIEVNYGALFDLMQKGICFFYPSGLLGFVLANVPFAGAFAAGFALGVKAG